MYTCNRNESTWKLYVDAFYNQHVNSDYPEIIDTRKNFDNFGEQKTKEYFK